MFSRQTYDWYRDADGVDDLYQVCDPHGSVLKSIVFWDDDPVWEARARAKAQRICRWLNRRPSFRRIAARVRRAFNPTANHPRANILDLLHSSHRIAAICDIAHVRSYRPDLTAEQAWQVLQEVDRHQHANGGITRVILEYAADQLFEKPTREGD
jgi:hypothetical protein